MAEKKMIIDEIECTFTNERNVLEVARNNGIDIPSLCYCENLSIYGGCRLCLVENERGAMDAACSMQPRNGMVVHTHTQKILDSRRTTLQLLMSSHRADCLTCEQSGSCKLQEYAHRYNVSEPRFEENTPGAMLLVPFALIVAQPDLGTALSLGMITVGFFYIVGANR
ncbi:MAG: (2Fe-2S)-binding protein, partial [Oscillospiraceae bacterium]|nr:(2Fe-2S)-binding protein [Oscillospiraceae bacterium]